MRKLIVIGLAILVFAFFSCDMDKYGVQTITNKSTKKDVTYTLDGTEYTLDKGKSHTYDFKYGYVKQITSYNYPGSDTLNDIRLTKDNYPDYQFEDAQKIPLTIKNTLEVDLKVVTVGGQYLSTSPLTVKKSAEAEAEATIYTRYPNFKLDETIPAYPVKFPRLTRAEP